MNKKTLSTFSHCLVAMVLISLPLSLYANSNKGSQFTNKKILLKKQPLKWKIVSGVQGADINSLIDVNGVVFVATVNGVFKSTDRGKSWIKSGLQHKTVNVLYKHRGVIYAGVGTDFKTPGLYSSVDDGKTWHSVGSLSYAIRGIVVFKNTIYALTVNRLWSYSMIHRVWNKIKLKRDINLRLIALDHGVLYTASYGHGLYKYTIKDKKWESLGAPLPGVYIDMIKIHNGLVYVSFNKKGLYYYMKKNKNWKLLGLKGESINAIHFSRNTIYVGTDSGFFTSNDNDKTWQKSNAGLQNKKIRAMLFQGSKIYLSTESSGMFESFNQGKSWQEINNGLTFVSITGLASSKDTLYVAVSGKGIFVGKHNGQNWHLSNKGLTDLNVSNLVTSGNTIYASTYHFLDNTSAKVFKSTDSGSVWSLANTGLENLRVRAFTTDNNQGRVYAGTVKGVYETINGGQSWQSLGSLDGYVTDIAFDNVHNIIYAIAGGYRSELLECKINNCSWQPIAIKDFLIQKLTVDAKGVIYARGYESLSSLDSSIYVSKNQGQSWKILLNLDSYLYIAHGVLYLNTTSREILESKDSGVTWFKLTDKPFYGDVTKLLVVGNKIYAGTDNGLFYASLQ